jgi:hypothetical protein
MESLWIEDPSKLFTKDNWWKFVPSAQTKDVPSAMNAILRFSVYLFTILFLAKGNTFYLLGIPLTMFLTVMAAKLFPKSVVLERFTDALSTEYTYPTDKNPFMNPLLTDILDNPNRPQAAPVTSNAVKQKIEDSFKTTSDLYMDTSDKFDLAQSMRTFHTIQSGLIPNNQEGFLKFLSKGIDEPDHSSAFPARKAKEKSEGYIDAPGSAASLPNTTEKPTGVTPASASSA